MSIDIKLQNRCDDVINWERKTFLADRRTIQLTYPVASVASVVLRINGVIQDPTTYKVLFDNDPLALIPTSHILMNEVSRLFAPIIEVKYVAVRTYCPKCAGLRYIDDFSYGPGKDWVTVSDELLLIQTLEKHIVTELRSNRYHTWVGTTLHDLVKQKITDLPLITTRIKDDVNKAVSDLKRLQAQYQKTRRPITRGELFGELLEVDVRPDSTEPTTIHAIVRFTSQSGKVLEYEQLLEFTELRRRPS